MDVGRVWGGAVWPGVLPVAGRGERNADDGPSRYRPGRPGRHQAGVARRGRLYAHSCRPVGLVHHRSEREQHALDLHGPADAYDADEVQAMLDAALSDIRDATWRMLRCMDSATHEDDAP